MEAGDFRIRRLVTGGAIAVALGLGLVISAQAAPTEAPANLHATAVTATSITVAWDRPTTPYPLIYSWFEGPAPGGPPFAGGGWPDETGELTYSFLVCGSTYKITIGFAEQAYDTSGPTSTIEVTTSPCTTSPPPAPTGLDVTGVLANRLSFAWDPAPAVDIVQAYYTLLGPGIGRSGFPSADKTSYDSPTLVCEEPYTFEVSWINSDGLTSPPTQTIATTGTCSDLGEPGAAPPGLVVSNFDRSSIEFSWTAPQAGVWLQSMWLDGPGYETTRRITTNRTAVRRYTGLNCATAYTFTLVWVAADGSKSEPATLTASTANCPSPPNTTTTPTTTTPITTTPSSGPPPVVPVTPTVPKPVADRTPPAFTVKARKLGATSTRVVRVPLSCSDSCVGRVTLAPRLRKQRGQVLPGSFGSAGFSLRSAAPGSIKIVVPKRAFMLLTKLRTVRVVAKIVGRDAAGNTGSASLRLTLTAPPRRG